MADLLEQATRWLDDMRKRHAARSVIYARGRETLEVAATVGSTTFDAQDRTGTVVRVESRDYLITTADLVLGGKPTLPERGDQIRETVGGQSFIYEVISPAGQPHYRYSDPFRQTLRIHTKYIGTQNA